MSINKKAPRSNRGLFVKQLSSSGSKVNYPFAVCHYLIPATMASMIPASMVSMIPATMVFSIPTSALAMIMLIIKPLIVTAALVVAAVIGIIVVEIFPVVGVSLIPGIPIRTVPLTGPDDIGGSVGIIWGPPVLGAEKVVQHPIQKPVAIVIDPGRIRSHPWSSVGILGWGWIAVALSISRGCDDADRAANQQNGQRQNNA
jgi:hypothetical protein